MYIATNINPWGLVNCFLRTENKYNNNTAKKAIAPSNKNAGLNGIGDMIPVIPNTNKMLNIFEPIIFPIAISDSCLCAAITLVTSSGKLVPIAMIVSPITRSETPIYRAILHADSTVSVLPHTNATKPNIINSAILIPLNFLIGASSSCECRDKTNKYPKNITNKPNNNIAPRREITPYCVPIQHNSNVINPTNGISYRTVFF